MEKIKILIAEDDVIVAMALRIRLEQLGFIVLEDVSNGLDAIAFSEQLKPDVILMDIKMPQMNGIEAAQKILEKQSLVSIVFLTAYDEIELIEKASLLDGTMGYLVKPVSDKNLVSAILMANYKKLSHTKQFDSGKQSTSCDNMHPGKDADKVIYTKTMGCFDLLVNGLLIEEDIYGISKSGPRKTKSILAYLVYKKGMLVSKEELAEVFWPMSDWVAAIKSLNRTIHSIKRILQPGIKKREDSLFISYINGMYKLNTDKISVDTDLFSNYLKSGYEEINKKNFKDAQIQLSHASRLYKGDWMKGVQNAEDWCLSERQRLKNNFLHAKFSLAEIARNEGKLEDALLHYQDAVAQDPFDEHANLMLVDAYLELGKKDFALKQKELYKNRLKTLDII